MVPIVELRVWTRYPGQFPGQVPAVDHTDYILEDPHGRMSELIKKMAALADKHNKVRFRTGTLNHLRNKWVLLVSQMVFGAVVRSLKKALRHAVVVRTSPVEKKLEDYEKNHVLLTLSEAIRMDFTAWNATKPFDYKAMVRVAYVSISTK